MYNHAIEIIRHEKEKIMETAMVSQLGVKRDGLSKCVVWSGEEKYLGEVD